MKFWQLDDDGNLVQREGKVVADGITYESFAHYWLGIPLDDEPEVMT